ncbi:hypothetical protein LWI29_031133 [Acer saccharum]|uniref:Uncharacterized protein n=1 Tax=Acer saccharum TaxID=4024 RepID=A0AA39RFC1_ACESA|nr:hypothetical protein LWI29_031133 [Acer saccharum]
METESLRLNAVDLQSFLRSAMEFVVAETAIVATNSIVWSLLMMGTLPDGTNFLPTGPDSFERFPFSELHAVKKPGPENKDGSDTEDDEEDEEEDAADDPDEEGEEEEAEDGSGEENDDEGDPEDEPEANGGGGSGDEDDDDDDDDDDGEEEEDEEEEEEDEDDDELATTKDLANVGQITRLKMGQLEHHLHRNQTKLNLLNRR